MPNYNETLNMARDRAMDRLASCETKLASGQAQDKEALAREIGILRKELTALSGADL